MSQSPAAGGASPHLVVAGLIRSQRGSRLGPSLVRAEARLRECRSRLSDGFRQSSPWGGICESALGCRGLRNGLQSGRMQRLLDLLTRSGAEGRPELPSALLGTAITNWLHFAHPID
jgi:hypothetical protein